MKASGAPQPAQPEKVRRLSPWLVYPLGIFVWWVLPWAISLIPPRFGWTAGKPGIWNLLGLLPVLVGTAGLFYGIAMHSAQSTEGVHMELDKDYLLSGGLYAYSRNPMYVSEMILILGWVIFYGSVAVLVATIAWFLFFDLYQIPREERVLEQHFGEAYREYKRRVPRWLGKRATEG